MHRIATQCQTSTLHHTFRTSQRSSPALLSFRKLTRAYHQIPVEPTDILKTAVVTPFGLLEFLRMRLRNAAQTFQRFIDQVLRGLHFCYAYVDDLLIASTSTTYGRCFSISAIRPLEEKVQVIRDFPLPKSHCMLREFLGWLIPIIVSSLMLQTSSIPLPSYSAHLTAEQRRFPGPKQHKRQSVLRRIHWRVPHSLYSPPTGRYTGYYG